MRCLKRLGASCLIWSAAGFPVTAQDLSSPEAAPAAAAPAEVARDAQEAVPADAAAPVANPFNPSESVPADAPVKANRALNGPPPVSFRTPEPAHRVTELAPQAPHRRANPYDQQLLMWADGAFNKSIEALRSGKTGDPEPAYRWSRRTMKAEEAQFGKPIEAARNHLRRMTDLEVMVKATAKNENKEANEYNFLISAVEYYRAEAEKLFEEATAESRSVLVAEGDIGASHDAVIRIAEEYLKAVLRGDTESAAKLAVPGSIAASERLMEGFQGLADVTSLKVVAVTGTGIDARAGNQTQVLFKGSPQGASADRSAASFHVSLVKKGANWLVANVSGNKSRTRLNNTVSRNSPSHRPSHPTTEQSSSAAPAVPRTMSIVALKYAQANAVHNIIRTLLDQAPLEGLRSTVDERTNRLVLSGTPEQLKEVLQLIEVLDVPGPEATNKTDDTPTTGTPQPVQR